MKVGVKLGHHRQAQLSRSRQRRPAKRPLGHHLHHIRAPQRPQLDQRAAGGQAKLEMLVSGNRQPAREDFLETFHVERRIAGVLARPDELDSMTQPQQSIHKPPCGHRHPVDLGRIGLGNHRDTQLAHGRAEALETDWQGFHACAL